MHSSISSSEPAVASAAGRMEAWRVMRRFLVVFLGMGAAVFLLIEILLRLAGISYPNFGKPDTARGWAARPGAEGWYRKEAAAPVYIRINSDGLRDREHSIPKPTGVFRIAILGNSYTEAFQVPLEQTYWAVAEREMAACLPPGVKRVEFINFGAGGYGTAQEFITLRLHVWKYQPDAVLLAFLASHDVWYNLRELSGQALAPYFVYRGDQLVLDDSFRKLVKMQNVRDVASPLENHVRTLQALQHAREIVKQWSFDTMHRLRAAVGNHGTRARPTDMVFVPPANGPWMEAWRVTEGLIRMTNEEVRRHGARFWIVTLSNPPQVHPEPAVRRRFAHELGVRDLFYPDLRIRELAQRESIPALNLSSPMAELAEKQRIFFHGFPGSWGQGHWNETGNRIAGQILARRLCDFWSSRQDRGAAVVD